MEGVLDMHGGEWGREEGGKVYMQYLTDANASIPNIVFLVTGTNVGTWCVNTLGNGFIAVAQVLQALINIC